MLIICMVAGGTAVIVLTRDTSQGANRPTTREWQSRYIKSVDNDSIRTHAQYYGAQSHLVCIHHQSSHLWYTANMVWIWVWRWLIGGNTTKS
jgi:YD repeat-containing protein